MKVALVCPYSLDVAGGVGTHVLGLARWLRQVGHDPFVIAPGERSVDEPFPVHTLGRAVGLRFNGSTANLALSPRQAARAVALTRGADVVHVHEPLTPGVAFASAHAAHRLVVTHHAHYTVPGPIAALLRRRARALGQRQAIAVSRAAAKTAALVTGSRPHVIPNAIDLPSRQHKKAERTVAFLGRRADPRKGHHIFRAVAERMAGEARFVEVSDGRASPEDVHAMLADATILMAPNTGGESFGLVVVEALAHGCGVVAARLGAFTDVVQDSAVVDWFTPGDVDDAVAALRRRLAQGTDPDRSRAVARAYSWDVVGPRVVEQYALGSLG